MNIVRDIWCCCNERSIIVGFKDLVCDWYWILIGFKGLYVSIDIGKCFFSGVFVVWFN